MLNLIAQKKGKLAALRGDKVGMEMEDLFFFPPNVSLCFLNFERMPVLSVISTFFFFKIFFDVGLFKSLLNFLKHCFCFLATKHVESLLPVQGLNSHPLEGEVLITGPTGKIPKIKYF